MSYYAGRNARAIGDDLKRDEALKELAQKKLKQRNLNLVDEKALDETLRKLFELPLICAEAHGKEICKDTITH